MALLPTLRYRGAAPRPGVSWVYPTYVESARERINELVTEHLTHQIWCPGGVDLHTMPQARHTTHLGLHSVPMHIRTQASLFMSPPLPCRVACLRR